ncbi:FAD-dependent monooxygenase [Microbacterium sp. CCNWLW134]|uniref:FAD-dependent oxidoreductase n=1 Tax=Microbacterium sp. CCNWLW134 TaxID=3122064 RepID=UPI00300FB580
MGFDHAIVIGAGIGGLLSAAALSRRYGNVTVIERDRLPDVPLHRRGVPQDEQMHAILAIGQESFEDLVPGVAGEFLRAGAAWYDSPRGIASLSSQGWAARGPSEAWIYGIRRVVLEDALRRKVTEIPQVRIVEGQVVGLHPGGEDAVRGIVLKGIGRPHLHADLVVDASGRTSHASDWLAELGFVPPPEQEIVNTVSYATAVVRLAPGTLRDDIQGYLIPPLPESPHGAVLLPCDNGLHQIVALSQSDSPPPATRERLIAHLEAVRSPVVAEAARRADFLGDPKPFRIRGSRRRRFEDMPVRPDGFVAIGDAVLALNPIYGQGMSVAAVEARTMRDILLETADATGAAGRIQEAFRPTLDFVFDSVVRSDGVFPGAMLHGLERPAAPKSRVLGALATEDWKTAVALRYAGHYFSAEPLQAPEIRSRARAWAASGRKPRRHDPRDIPRAFDGAPLPR